VLRDDAEHDPRHELEIDPESTINGKSRQRNLQNATLLGEDGITELRRLLARYRDALRD